MIRKFVLPVLIAFLFLVLFFAVWSAVADKTTRVQSLSAIASSISAMIAIVVALWTDLRDRKHRLEERAEQKNEQLKSRRVVAALCSGEINAWLQRKDIEDIVADLRNIQDKDSLQSGFKFLVNEKLESLSKTKETDSNLWGAQIQYVSLALRLGVFQRMSSIPNIWTAQFKRDDIKVLEGNAPAYFIVMDTIWTNLNLKAQQLSVSVDVLRLFSKEESALMPLLVNAIAEDAIELREHITEFLTVAEKGALALADDSEKALPKELKSPLDLLTKSRDRSQRMSEAWRLISLARTKPFFDQVKEVERQVADVKKTLE